MAALHRPRRTCTRHRGRDRARPTSSRPTASKYALPRRRHRRERLPDLRPRDGQRARSPAIDRARRHAARAPASPRPRRSRPSPGDADAAAVRRQAARARTGCSTRPRRSFTTFQWFRCDRPARLRADPRRDRADLHAHRRGRRPRACCVDRHRHQRRPAATTLGCSGSTNTIFPRDPATQLTPADDDRHRLRRRHARLRRRHLEVPGHDVTRASGRAATPTARAARRSRARRPRPTSIKAADLGQRLRVRISADSNGSNTFPAAIEVFTPLSAVVTDPPPPPADPTPTAARRRQPRPRSPAPGARGRRRRPAPDKTAPVLQSLGAVSAKLKPSAALKLQVGALRGRLAVGRAPARPRRPQAGQDLQGRRQEGQEVHGRSRRSPP